MGSHKYWERKAWAVERLGGKCAKCGSTEELEFDHIDPATKSFTVASRLDTGRIELLELELKKCQLLCLDCHNEKTAYEIGSGPIVDHGYVMYCKKKCRCDVCRKGNAAYQRSYQSKAPVAKLAYALRLGRSVHGHVGSNPTGGTNLIAAGR